MISLKLNGLDISVEKGTTLLEAAQFYRPLTRRDHQLYMGEVESFKPLKGPVMD